VAAVDAKQLVYTYLDDIDSQAEEERVGVIGENRKGLWFNPLQRR
jgi:hypothetical protein